MSMLRLFAVLLCVACDVAAQAYPAKVVRVVVPFPASGGSDVIARIFAPPLAEALGQQIVIDNRAGANGNIGTEMVARSAADGYTLLFNGSGTLAINPGLYGNLPFDAMRDFAPISLIVLQPHVLVVHPSVPAQSVKELIALAHSAPGKLNFASSGSGSLAHLGGELFKSMAQVDMVHVPYKGAGAVLQDLMAGQVQAMIASLPTILPHVKSGKLRALMVLADQRTPHLPEVPAAKEAGFPGMVMTFWVNFAAPAGTPRPIIERLNREVVAALQKPATKARLNDLGLDAVGGTPEQATKLAESEIQRWGGVIRAANIKAD